MKVIEIQKRINSYIFYVIFPYNAQNPTEQLTKDLTDLQLIESKLKKIHIDLDNRKNMLTKKEKKNSYPPRKVWNISIINIKW